MKKKITQFKWLVTMLLLVTAMAMPKMAWAETYDQNGFAKDGSYQPATPTTDQYDINGDGTKDEVYEIGNAGQLYWFAALVNGTLTDVAQNTSACAVLVSDITVNTDLLNSLDDNGDPTGTVTIESWTPFGYYNSNTDKAYYSGTFDGQGHSINGLYRKQPNEGKISFCGVIGGGTIKNVAIIDSYFEGEFSVGGITGLSKDRGTIINCLYQGIVKGNRWVGGICGAVYYITISDCFFNGEIRKFGDNQQKFGAICGNSVYANHFKNCVYNKDLFDGYAIEDGILESCTLTSVTGMTTDDIESGKAALWLNRNLVGKGIGWYQNIDNGQTRDAYPVLDNTHGVVYASQPCPSSGNLSNNKSSLTEVQHSWDAYNVCTQCGKTKDVLDLVEGFQEPSQVGGVYQISTAGELYWFTALVNGLLTDGTRPNRAANAVLTNDITVNSNVLNESGNLAVTSDTRLDWIPIGNSDRPYTGSFDGQGYTISGLYFNDSSKDNVGLFGYIYGKIQNTGVIDSYFEGNKTVGGLCGTMRGEMKDCFSRSFVKGCNEVGGVCGDVSGGKVENAYQAGIVCGSSETATNVNGIFGSINASISGNSQCSNCYYDTTLCPNMNACGSTSSSSATNVEGRSTTEFASGEVAYLLNNRVSDGTQRWYQNLSAESGEEYPVLKSTGTNTVYKGYRHNETTLLYLNNQVHAHAYDSSASDEPSGNHDMSYEQNEQNPCTWKDTENYTNATAKCNFTCTVCNSEVAKDMNVTSDNEHPNKPVTCLEDGFNYYKATLTFNGNSYDDSYIQNVPKLGHDMPGNASLNSELQIYQKGCKREGCRYADYYATSDGNVVANITESGFVANALTLEDAKKYDNQAVFTATNFTYTRTFSNTNWTTWYVPFELTLTEEICSKFAFSRINNVHQYDTDNDGNADKTVVESFRQTEGVTLKANYPYLVKPVSGSDLNMELNLTNVKPALAKAESIDCQSVDYTYVFTGTYNGEGESGSSLYDPYTLYGDGTWQHYHSLEPMRHYLTISSRNATTSAAAFMRSILLSVIGDENATGIVKIYDEERRAKDTYDLGGRCIPAGSQRNGFYIENGKVIYKK